MDVGDIFKILLFYGPNVDIRRWPIGMVSLQLDEVLLAPHLGLTHFLLLSFGELWFRRLLWPLVFPIFLDGRLCSAASFDLSVWIIRAMGYMGALIDDGFETFSDRNVGALGKLRRRSINNHRLLNSCLTSPFLSTGEVFWCAIIMRSALLPRLLHFLRARPITYNTDWFFRG